MAEVYLTPETLHPTAASSFANILQYKLHSLLCVVGFRHGTRGLGEFPGPGWRCHFAQTFPLRRRGHPTGGFHWLTADPRPGVKIDLRQLPLNADPRFISRGWCHTEKQQTARENNHGGLRFYICPIQRWPNQAGGGPVGAEDEEEEVWSWDELAQYLQFEAEL